MIDVLLNALPEIVGGLIVAGLIALVGYFLSKLRRSVEPSPTDIENLSFTSTKLEIPSNLPARTDFIGREKEKARVIEALDSRSYLICIDGIAGIGKTSLALEVANECLVASRSRCRDDKTRENTLPIFDGFIWTTAKDRELKLRDILDEIARVMGYPGIIQQSFEEKRVSIQKLLSKSRCLLIIDNFETIVDDAVQDFLLHLPEPSKALITSREQTLRQTWEVSLKGLEKEEGLLLIRSEGRRLELETIEKAQDTTLLNLYDATGGAPLAIKWAMGQIKQQGQALDTILSDLYQAKGDVFEDMFDRSWSLLSNEARKILMIMTIFVSSATKNAIEESSDVHHFDLDRILAELVQMWLIEVTDELEVAKRKYGIHPLTRFYASKKLLEKPKLRNEASNRMVQYYLQYVKQHGGRDWHGYDNLEEELQNIMIAINWCNKTEKWELITLFRIYLTDFLGVRCYWNERVYLAERALLASRKLNDRRNEAICMVYDLGWTIAMQGKLDKGKKLISDGLEIFKKLQDNSGIALAFRTLGYIALRENEIEEAKNFFSKSLEFADKSGDNFIKGKIRITLGYFIYFKEKKFNEARKLLNIARQLFLEEDDEIGLARALHVLGMFEYKEGNRKKAKSLYYESLDIFSKAGQPFYKAFLMKDLAMLEESTKNKAYALKLAKEAYEIFTTLGISWGIEETQEMINRLEKKLK